MNAGVYRYPLVRRGATDAAGLVAIVRRLAVARTISEVMQITTQAARSLMHADGVTFVLRDGDLLLRRGGCCFASLEGTPLSYECVHFRVVHDGGKTRCHSGHLRRPSHS
jgi:hypothetical protein